MLKSNAMINPSSLNLFVRQEKPVANGSFQTSLKIPATLPYFDGHFPENPILPGVAMIDLSLEALKVYVEEFRPLIGVSAAKYLGLVQPNDALEIHCTKNSENEWQIVWTKENKKVCDLILNFG